MVDMDQSPSTQHATAEQLRDMVCENPRGIFSHCPHCESRLIPEHAHYKCTTCGWRDSCCD